MTCVELPETTRQSLMSQCRQLKHLAMLFQEVRRKNKSRLVPLHSISTDEIKLKHELVQLIAMYLEVILWFFNVGLLPEVSFDDEDPSEESAHYPVRLLARQYQTKRQKMKTKLSEWLGGDSLMRSRGTVSFVENTGLMIDGLCQTLQPSLKVS